MGMFEFQLTFTVFCCDGCGRERLAIDPPCACDPTEVLFDENVRERRQLVWDAAPVVQVESPPRTVGGDELSDTLEKLSTLVPDIIAAVQSIGSQEVVGLTQLKVCLTDLRYCITLTERARWLRPWHRTWSKVRDALLAVEDMTSQYLFCLTADCPSVAKSRSEAAQIAIDQAASNASELSDIIDLWSLVPDEAHDPLASVVGAAFPAYVDSGASGLLDLDRLGQNAWARITGSEKPPTGIGAAFAIPEYVAAMVMDETRYVLKARLAFEELTRHPGMLRRVLDDQAWATAYKKAMEVAHDSIIELNLLATGATTERLEIRSLIGFGAELYETIAQPLLIGVLAARNGKSVSSLLKKKPQGIISQIEDSHIGILAEGLSAQIRNVAAHNDYEVNGTEVTLNPGQPGSTIRTVAELTDSILSGVETVLAIHVGVMCALLSNGISLDELPGTEDWELSEPQRITMVLGLAGWSSIDMAETDDVVEITGHGIFPTNPISLGGACLAALEANWRFLILHAKSGKTTHTLRMPTGPFSMRTETADSWLAEILFVEGCLQSTFDTRPIFTSDQGRKWISMQAGRVLAERGTLRKLKALAGFADRVGYDDIATGLVAAMRVKGAQTLGLTPTASDIDSMTTVAEWEERLL